MDPRLSQVRSASLSDAMRRLHPHRHHVLDLVTPTPGRVLAGPAATMLFAPLRADVPKEAQSFDAHAEAAARGTPKGRVLVAAAPGAEDAAVAGGLRLGTLAALGYGGLLTTARVRDLHEARAMELAVYCRGATPLAGSSQAMPVATNVPLALDGATVLPGDIVVADEAGAVIVPAKDLDRALALALEIDAQDAERARRPR